MPPADLTATEAAGRIAAGALTSEELVAACLARIAEREEAVQAWAHLDPDHALAQARAVDRRRRAEGVLGPLHGVPVGVKDIFDTRDMPTENGSALHAGRTPDADATAVARLRAAGAVVMGKTVTTEFALYAPGKTRNPHDPTRTPGGSSSGSAAAVAAGMVPLAIGSQTNGSVIRPASFCGVFGYKPTHGLIPRHRMLPLSRVLDHVGVFARSVQDLALIVEALAGFDEADPDTAGAGRPPLARVTASEPPRPPRFAFVRTPHWDEADEDTRSALAALVDRLGDQVREVRLPPAFDEAAAAHRVIMESDLARFHGREYDRGRERMSDRLREMIERGRTYPAVDYLRAVDGIAVLNRLLAEVFRDADALLTPAAPGEAPRGLESTGNPVFCTLWTLCGTPAVSLPLLEGADALPIGVQLVGPRGDDARLLRTARWLDTRMAGKS